MEYEIKPDFTYFPCAIFFIYTLSITLLEDFCKFCKLNFSIFSIGFSEVATFSITQLKTLKLVHQGYSYIKSGKKDRWQCSKTRREKCRGKAQTRLINSRQMIKVSGEHNHPPNFEQEF